MLAFGVRLGSGLTLLARCHVAGCPPFGFTMCQSPRKHGAIGFRRRRVRRTITGNTHRPAMTPFRTGHGTAVFQQTIAVP
jgi:hypothetical protein